MSDQRELLADLEHEQWAHWTTYLFKSLGLWDLTKDELLRLTLTDQIGGMSLGGAMFTREQVDNLMRWRRQCETPYEALSEKEKDSDREWADKVLAILNPTPEQPTLKEEKASVGFPVGPLAVHHLPDGALPVFEKEKGSRAYVQDQHGQVMGVLWPNSVYVPLQDVSVDLSYPEGSVPPEGQILLDASELLRKLQGKVQELRDLALKLDGKPPEGITLVMRTPPTCVKKDDADNKTVGFTLFTFLGFLAVEGPPGTGVGERFDFETAESLTLPPGRLAGGSTCLRITQALQNTLLELYPNPLN